MICVVAYDIPSSSRRTRLSRMLESMGPRVQKSVFEVVLSDSVARQRLVDAIDELIDGDADQVRLYDIGSTARRTTVVGRGSEDDWRGFVLL